MDITPQSRPWWKFGYVWLVIGGPAVVVVAALATGWIALRYGDPVVDQDYYRHGLEINAARPLAEKAAPLLPAELGRNHAASPDAAGRLPQPRRKELP